MINPKNEIYQMIIKANLKKRELEKQLEKAENKKRQDERELQKFEMRVYEKSKRQDNAFLELSKIIHEKGLVKNDNKEISKLYKSWMDIDKKVGQLQRWIKQAEAHMNNDKKQREALSQAKYVFKTM